MREDEIPDKNIFMCCKKLNLAALREMPVGFFVRNLKPAELDAWKEMPFDDKQTAIKYSNFMTDYFNNVYKTKLDEFFNRCLVVIDEKNKQIVATCFIWKAYEKINTIHWWKVKKHYEGKGIGRALLSVVMQGLLKEDYPVYLHTQPASFRAIKLYSDFGFEVLTNNIIGFRRNDFAECIPILQEFMPKQYYEQLKTTKAPKQFLNAVKSSEINQF